MNEQQQHVLITGAAGFLGNSLAERLKNRYRISGLDTRPGKYVDNLHHVEFLDLKLLLNSGDTVFHFAAPNEPAWCENHPDETIQAIVLGTEHVLSNARAAGARVIVATSSAVLDARDIGMYATAKACAEKVVRHWENRGLKVALVRYWNVYGPGQRPTSIVPRLISNAINGTSTTVYRDDKDNARDFVHIDDVNDFHEMLLASQSWGRQTFNIGSHIATNIADLANLVARLAGGPPPILSDQEAPGGTSYPRMDYEWPAGWRPKITLEEGLRGLIAEARGRVAPVTPITATSNA